MVCCDSHFEVTLVNDALLAKPKVEAWQVTGDPEFRRVAEEGQVLPVGTGGTGGALGVDSWAVTKYFGVTARGNTSAPLSAGFEGKNILHVERDLEEAAAKGGPFRSAFDPAA